MNALVRTRAAEGYDRAAFTIAAVERMVTEGILPDDNSFELWKGEIVPKVTKNDPHEVWKRLLARWMYRALPDSFDVAVQPTLRLDPATFVEPDLLIHAAAILPSAVRGSDVLLAVEVADTSLQRDLSAKAALYAEFGVAHYWVIDAVRQRAFLHSERAGDAYQRREEVGASARLALPFEPTLSFSLAELRRDRLVP